MFLESTVLHRSDAQQNKTLDSAYRLSGCRAALPGNPMTIICTLQCAFSAASKLSLLNIYEYANWSLSAIPFTISISAGFFLRRSDGFRNKYSEKKISLIVYFPFLVLCIIYNRINCKSRTLVKKII